MYVYVIIPVVANTEGLKGPYPLELKALMTTVYSV